MLQTQVMDRAFYSRATRRMIELLKNINNSILPHRNSQSFENSVII